MDVPKGLWYKSPTGKIIDADELERNLFVSQKMVFMLELVVVPILKFYLTTMNLLDKKLNV
jgi:hypothetical protein